MSSSIFPAALTQRHSTRHASTDYARLAMRSSVTPPPQTPRSLCTPPCRYLASQPMRAGRAITGVTGSCMAAQVNHNFALTISLLPCHADDKGNYDDMSRGFGLLYFKENIQTFTSSYD